MAVLARGRFPELHMLDVSDNALDSGAAAALAQGGWPQLRVLDVSNNPDMGSGIAHIARARWPLQALGVSYMGLGGAGIVALADDAQHWPLVELVAGDAGMSPEHALLLLERARWPGFHRLALYDVCGWDEEARARVLRSAGRLGVEVDFERADGAGWGHCSFRCSDPEDLAGGSD